MLAESKHHTHTHLHTCHFHYIYIMDLSGNKNYSRCFNKSNLETIKSYAISGLAWEISGICFKCQCCSKVARGNCNWCYHGSHHGYHRLADLVMGPGARHLPAACSRIQPCSPADTSRADAGRVLVSEFFQLSSERINLTGRNYINNHNSRHTRTGRCSF